MPPNDRLDHLLQCAPPCVPRLRVPSPRVPGPRPRHNTIPEIAAVTALAADDRGGNVIHRARHRPIPRRRRWVLTGAGGGGCRGVVRVAMLCVAGRGVCAATPLAVSIARAARTPAVTSAVAPATEAARVLLRSIRVALALGPAAAAASPAPTAAAATPTAPAPASPLAPVASAASAASAALTPTSPLAAPSTAATMLPLGTQRM